MTKKHRILIVDDDVDYTEIVKHLFEETCDYDVSTVNEGAGAVEKIRRFNPEMVLLDVCLPDIIDGGIIASELQADPDLQHIPVLFVTGLVEAQDQAVDCRFSGGLRFLSKLTPMNKLTGLVQSMVESRPCQELVCCPAA